ncbi:hypothetical protein JCM14076_13740 [Methylosoma difficile]
MKFNNSPTCIAASTLVLLSACASAPTPNADARDPYERWNRKVYSFNQVVDGYVLKPVAKGYDWIMPDFANQGVTNFFSNIDDISVIVNSTLQGKLAQAGSDSARLVVNTTAGVAGLFDVASRIDLPKHEENFDKTLGSWGVGKGSYLVLPIFGPSSTRGLAGTAVDMTANPLQFMGLGTISMVDVVDKRSDMLPMDKIVDEAATKDRYVFFKNMYLSGDEDPMGELSDGINKK